jgi:hypothetical protein
MKQAQVVIGGTYLTKVGARVVRVIAVEQTSDTFSGRTKYRVAPEERPEVILPRSRAASALHPAK